MSSSGAGTGTCYRRIEHTVPAEGEGQRAFNWSRRGAFSRQLQSKKQALQAFKERRMLLGGVPVEETRCLQEGDVLTLLHDPEAGCRAQAAGKKEDPVIVLHAQAEWAVVHKPSGVRACGDFPGTLQACLKLLLPASHAPPPPPASAPLVRGPMPVSRIEMGCTGVTLVARSQAALDVLVALAAADELEHTFVALVHGRVPEEWAREGGATLRLAALKSKRVGMAKRKGGKGQATAGGAGGGEGAEGEGDDDEEEDDEDECGEELEEEEEAAATAARMGAATAAASDGMVTVSVLSTTDAASSVALTTVRLVCGARRGRLCGDLCYLLRSAGRPVVGDRYARRERGSLPRYCAPLKQKSKPHMTCVGVRADLPAKVLVNSRVPPWHREDSPGEEIRALVRRTRSRRAAHAWERTKRRTRRVPPAATRAAPRVGP